MIPDTWWRFHHSYRSGFWGLAYGYERVHAKGFEGAQWFVHLGRKVWVFRRLDSPGAESGGPR